MMQDFAAFEQRPDNKLWIFYEKTPLLAGQAGGTRLRKVYVFAYTWFDARKGALTGLNPLQSKDVEGSEVDVPEEDLLIEEGSTLVFTDKLGRFHLFQTLKRMSGKEARGLCVFPKTQNTPGSDIERVEEQQPEDLDLLNSIRQKLHHTKPVRTTITTNETKPLSVLSEASSALSSTVEITKDGGRLAYNSASAEDVRSVHDQHEYDDRTSDDGSVGISAAAAEESVDSSVESDKVEAIPILLWCPICRHRHIDEGEFATKLHHTHACQSCGLVWRPAIQPTVGVMFLPGFLNPVKT